MDFIIFTVFYIKSPINRVDPIQMPRSVASELSLHQLHDTPKWVSDLNTGTDFI